MKIKNAVQLILLALVFLPTMALAATPTVSIASTPTTITYGTKATIVWSSTNALSCKASGGIASDGWAGAKSPSGSFTTSALTQSTGYSISCTGRGGTQTASTTVWVQSAAASQPIVTFTATPISVAYQGSAILVWTTINATTCTASGGWSGSQATSGQMTLTNLLGTATYTLACRGPGGPTSNSVTISVALPPPPVVSLSASQTSIANGATSQLTWQSTNATSCLASNGWIGTEPLSGVFTTPPLTSSTTYNLTCTGLSGTTTQPITINVAPPPGNAGSRMGINISWINDWGDRDLTFIDIMKQARGFATLAAPWDPVNNPVSTDANGWPTTDFGIFFITNPSDPLNRPLTTTFPSMFGTYKLSFTGTATVKGYNCCQIQNTLYNASTNTTTADVVVGTSDVSVALTFTGTTNGVQNLQLFRPGYPIGTTQVFTNEFLNALAPFSTLRFMEALQTNNNHGSTWAARKPKSDPTQQDPRGISWEYVIELANASGKDIWINIPDQVDLTDSSTNNYVIQLATLIQGSLNQGIHVYVEYSNELWNGGFTQTAANTAAAVADVNSGTDITLNYDNGGNQWYWGYRRAAHQTLKISQLFAEVFGQPAINTTIRPVYMSQYAQPFITEDALRYLNANFGAPNNYIYGIGGAPYFSAQSSYSDMTGLFSSLQTGLNLILPGFSPIPAYNGGVVYSGIQFKNMAAYYGLKTLMYEGGPDLSNNTNAALAEQAAYSPAMNAMIESEWTSFLSCGNDLFVYYKLSTPPGDSPWGIYEDVTVPTAKSQMFTALSATPLSTFTNCN